MRVKVEACFEVGWFGEVDRDEVKDFFEVIPEAAQLTLEEPGYDTLRRVCAEWAEER